MTKLQRARQLGPDMHASIWAELFGNRYRSWSRSFAATAAARRAKAAAL